MLHYIEIDIFLSTNLLKNELKFSFYILFSNRANFNN